MIHPVFYTNKERGAAMMEFIVCLFPYLIVLMAAIFFWHLAAGKQELFDYAQAAASLDSVGADGFKAFGGQKTLKGGGIFAGNRELEYNAKFGVDAAVDEPVLPYNSNGKDFSASVVRNVYNITANTDGTINVAISASGKRLQELGMISDVVTGKNLPADTDLNFTINDSMAAGVAAFLSDWIECRAVDGGRYHYHVNFGAGSNLGLEKGPVTENWRSSLGVTVGGDRSSGAAGVRIVGSNNCGTYESPQLGDLQSKADVGSVSITDLPVSYFHKYPLSASE